MDLTSLVLEKAADQGFVVLILCVAVWWLNRGNGKLINSLNRERSERITTLETKVDECEKDRSRLWDRLVGMALHRGESAEPQSQPSTLTHRQ